MRVEAVGVRANIHDHRKGVCKQDDTLTTNVKLGTITSSPDERPRAVIATSNAAVPLVTAIP